jgi:hypothetical protein
MEHCEVVDMLGATIVSISGMQDESEAVIFTAQDGRSWHMWYQPDCCARCYIVQIDGDVQDLIGSPLLMSEEISNEGASAPEGYYESYTWTFYKFATIKGYVTLRWLGSSNGYYSESVSFARVAPDMN